MDGNVGGGRRGSGRVVELDKILFFVKQVVVVVVVGPVVTFTEKEPRNTEGKAGAPGITIREALTRKMIEGKLWLVR